ncbi:fimbrial protein [Providencia vermicola]|uniref:fimbrial protein n=1 Tax=Providencia TaxID=586 RepID=UPI0012B58C29|nr:MULTISPECIES: fimbrial protein [Providencia]MTB39262.1 type 1 fimbrial protein [Providencia sp. wls1949]MTC08003.1 type 1 fimbrial protein [Providencia sp. wls1948]QIC16177.1 type 1 fimbrial protein [Providencia vermicola]
MNKLLLLGCTSMLLFTQSAAAEFRALFKNLPYTVNTPIYVSRTAPVGTELASIELGTYTAWSWSGVTDPVQVGLYFPSLPGNSPKYNGAYVRELNNSGVGYALYGNVISPCTGHAYVDGLNTIDGNVDNRMICQVNSSSGEYIVSLKIVFYKMRNNVKTQVLPATQAAMLIIYNNGFKTRDSYGNTEPKVSLGPVDIISTGCEVINNNIVVPFNSVDKGSFSGVGSVSPNSVKDFKINLSCDPVSPIKITFTGTAVDNSLAPGTIALNNPSDINTAKGYGIQVKYKDQPIKINQMMTIEERNSATGLYSIPLQAAYIQTSNNTQAGQANGTLQFNLQYH